MKKQLLDTVAIVDGASTSAHLAPAFRSYGVRCVHVLSSELLPERLQTQINPADYVRSVVHRGDLQQTADALRDLGISVVLPGVDSGVELASRLADALGAPLRNPVELTAARRDKFEQIEALRRAGVRTPQQFQSRSSEEIAAWAREHARLPVVVKPTRSSGVKGVKICRTPEQVEEAARNVLAIKSSYDEVQEDILIQSYSEGQEYIVDAVSFGGQHKVVSLWEVERDRSHSPRLEKMLVVDHTQAEYAQVIAYAAQVLDAVGLHYGPSHLELIVTAEGPTIVELNSRLHGSLDPRLTTAVTGENQISATVEAFVNPQLFKQTLNDRPRFSGFCGHILLVSPKAGVLAREFDWDSIERLPSCVSVKRWVKTGDRVNVTTDLRTALGMVGLFDAQFDRLTADWQSIRQIEHRFFSDPETLAA
ncbi:ATP-grasp domain-containing protein [Variovorax sp. OV700]|uniref:ATP-grasp domain-containing protein n=1 Tax=Variovorax sp. OV700 TaxID=1882826 RepID=UPI000886109C|nr:ATP-grasp domain-containing protein [Variovorax sp. OV700]SDI18451.1 ATP-grasp domain-containing protein [Variovorax sp. OV700]